MTDAAASLPLRDLPLLWLGSRGGLEAGLVNRAGLPFRAIRGSGLHGVGWRLPLNAMELLIGLGEAIKLVRAYQPDVLLVTGGSRGARSINRAVLAALSDWLKDYQVMHLTGELDWAEAEQARAALPADLQARYHAFPFLHEMGLALAAADLVVSRAGASALGEYPLFGLPAILVPYPYAWRYQKVNADYLVGRGAALRLNDEDLARDLAGQVRGLLSDPARLSAMKAASKATAKPGAAERIAAELATMARQP